MNTFAEAIPWEASLPPVIKPSQDLIELDGQTYRRHVRGGGLVAMTAYAARDTFIGQHAIVSDYAIVMGLARLFDEARVKDHAVVSDMCTLRDNATVTGHAILRGSVLMTDQAYVGGYARIDGPIKLQHFARVLEGDLRGQQTIW